MGAAGRNYFEGDMMDVKTAELIALIRNALLLDRNGIAASLEKINERLKKSGDIEIAEKITKLIRSSEKNNIQKGMVPLNSNILHGNGIKIKTPQKTLADVFVSEKDGEAISRLIKENENMDILAEHGLYPRHKILLFGPPGNGKTSCAEAIAESLMRKFMIIDYSTLIASHLGETAGKMSKAIDEAKKEPCVLFFDEFETIAKERNDSQELGEIKRVASSLLLLMDDLPPHVLFIAATNHESMLDSAVWRRFHLKITLPNPEDQGIKAYLGKFEEKMKFSFCRPVEEIVEHLHGESYAAIEEYCLAAMRDHILDKAETEHKTSLF
jgi:SpoVK/Ycf46/Vps4 family AAA+-type ATPase